MNVFLASALQSFGQIFPDRAPPTLYCEKHGRDAWEEEVDLSGTVGCFNTLVPLSLGMQHLKTFEKTVHRIRTTREKIAGQGESYFAYLCLDSDGREACREYSNMEISLNHTGYRHLEDGSALLRHETLSGQGSEDIGTDTRRLALLNILVDFSGGCLKYTFL